MREDRGRQRDVDEFVDFESRYARRKVEAAPNLSSVRGEWEPTVCPQCGTEHPDTSNVRVRRSGQEFEARCTACGTIAARYVAGVWSS
jgi:RNase P subunit RPR2